MSFDRVSTLKLLGSVDKVHYSCYVCALSPFCKCLLNIRLALKIFLNLENISKPRHRIPSFNCEFPEVKECVSFHFYP